LDMILIFRSSGHNIINAQYGTDEIIIIRYRNIVLYW